MYITIDGVKYAKLASLSFAPETDLTGDGSPVNRLQADIITQDDIAIGRYARLYDDRNRLWAKYWIAYAERQNRKTVRVIADSDIRLLDRAELDAVMWAYEPVTGIVEQLFAGAGIGGAYTLDPSFDEFLLSGYCPAQTARQRLQMVCMRIGAYVRSYASEYIEIVPLDETVTLIPLNRTFWKPAITWRDWVTRLVIRDYEYEEGEPSTTDDYVKVDDTEYIETYLDYAYDNPDAPAAAPENEVRVEDMKLYGAASAVSARLGAYWFGRMDVELDVINNGEYWPGDRVIVYTEENAFAIGYIEKCDFRFGLQARAKLRVSMAETRPGAALEIRYLDEQARRIAGKTLSLPVGWPYSIDNPYIDRTENGVRTVYRPLEPTVTGVMPDDGETVDVPCEAALRLHNGVLDILSVDSATQEEGEVTIE